MSFLHHEHFLCCCRYISDGMGVGVVGRDGIGFATISNSVKIFVLTECKENDEAFEF